jgi:hypothetical protein
MYRHPQQGTNRYASGANGANTYQLPSPSSPQQNRQPQDHHRRQNEAKQPHVRLPSAVGASPPSSDRECSPGNRNITSSQYWQPPPADLNTAHPTQNPRKEARPRPVPHTMRRHRPSTSNSSKASTGSNPWSTFTSPKTSTQPSSPASTQPTIPLDVKTASLSLNDSRVDEEWLLLRSETIRPKSLVNRDKYDHLHPLVRKYASHIHPEMKAPEPTSANAVQCRRWEREETLERDRAEMLASQAVGNEELSLMTCMTEIQDRSYRLAMEALALMTEYDDETDLETLAKESINKSGAQKDGV